MLETGSGDGVHGGADGGFARVRGEGDGGLEKRGEELFGGSELGGGSVG